MKSSPLFRWRFESPKRPIQRTDSEETFFELAEKDEIKETFQNNLEDVDMIESSQYPLQRSFFSSDGFADEALSQGEHMPLLPVPVTLAPRNNIPSEESTPSNLDFSSQNKSEMSCLFPERPNDVHLETQNFQAHKWTNESRTKSSRYSEKWTVLSNETYFEEEDEFCAARTDEHSLHRNNQNNLETSQEMLTGLDDSQFSAYPTNHNYGAASTDETCFDEKEIEQADVKSRCKLPISKKSTCKATEDSEMSIKILTGLNNSQFNAYPTDSNSQTPSTDATFFDFAGKQNETFSGLHHSCQEDGHDVHVAELPIPSTSCFRSVPLNENPGPSCITSVPAASPNLELSQDIIELIEDMPPYPIFDMTYFNNIVGMLESTTDPSDLICISPTFDGTAEIVNQLNVSPSFSSPQSSPLKDIRQISHHIINKQKRVLPLLNVGETKKRKTNDLQRVRTIGKPTLSRMKKAKKIGVPLTPRHSMTLRTRLDRSADITPKISSRTCSSEKTPSKKSSPLDPIYVIPESQEVGNHKNEFFYQESKSTPQTVRSKLSGKQTPGQGRKKVFLDPDFISVDTRKFNTPRKVPCFGKQTPLTKARKQGKIPKLKVSCEGTPIQKRGSSKKIEITPKKFISNLSKLEINGTGCSTSKGKYSRRRTSPRIGNLNAGTPGKLFRGRPSNKAKKDSVDHLWAELNRDETCLRNIRRKLLDVIYDESTITRTEAENIRREIREKHQRLLMWNQCGLGGKKVCRQMKELETLCETLLHQIGNILADLCSGESKFPDAPEKNSVSQCSDAMSVNLHPAEEEIISGTSHSKKAKLKSKKSNSRGIVHDRRQIKLTTPVKQSAITGTNRQGSSRSCEKEHLASPGINSKPHSPPGVQPLGPSPGQKLLNISGMRFQKREEMLNKSHMDEAVPNLHGRRKNTPAKHSTESRDRNYSEFSRVISVSAGCVDTPRCPPVKLVSSLDLREDTLAEHTLSARKSNGRKVRLEPVAGRSPINVCVSAFACGAGSTKAYVDVGTITDFNEVRISKKILVDRSNNTDPEDLYQGLERKVLVDSATNTEYFCSAGLTSMQVGRKVFSSVNKENIETELDLKNIDRVWLPRPEDFLRCSYDHLSPEYFANPNALLPQELLDDLSWED